MASAVVPTHPRSRRLGNVALGAFALALSITGCESSPQAHQDVASAFDPGLRDPGVVAAPVPAPGCYADRYSQPDAVVTKKVDVLLLVDTSSSLDEEREKVADGIDAFVRALPSDADYRIAMIFAHGRSSARAGRIYSKHRRGSEMVLRSDLLEAEDLRQKLRTDLMNVVGDPSADGGEMGMYSLTRALDDDRLAESRSLGFFREDAALVLIAVSDENDICATYPNGVRPVPDPQGSENSSRNSGCVRNAPARVVDGVTIAPSYTETITAESVVRKLQDLQAGRPLVVSAIAYTDPSTVPAGGENEYGYGWLDMVELTGGVKVEMSDGSYESGLSRIGALTTVKLSLQKEFSLTRREIDEGSIDARVDGASVPFTYIPTLNQVSLEELGSARSTVDLLYCDPRPEPSPSPSPSPTPTGVAGVDPLCQAGSFTPKGSLRVGLSIDPAEGSSTLIRDGFTSIGSTPTVYTDAQIAAGLPTLDGVTVLVVSRKAVITPVSGAYVAGVRDYLAQGGSLLAEYDGAALLFDRQVGISPSYANRFTTNLGLFSGNVAGGGLLLPVGFSSAFVINTSHPVMIGVPTTIETGPRAAFAVTDYPATWLEPLATFSASGSTGSIPAGTFPAVLAGRCGQGRVAILPMNHFQAFTYPAVKTIVGNALNWLIGL